MFLYFFIHRHNESKRRLKNVSLAWGFLLLWCISGPCLLRTHSRGSTPDPGGERVCMGGGVGYSTRLFCCVWASRVSGTCEPCMPTLAWAAGILHVRKLMSLFSCKTQFKPHNSWQFDNEAAWTPIFFFSPPLFSHLSLDTVIFILQLVFLPLNLKVFMGGKKKLVQKWKLRTEHNQKM